MYVVPRLGGYQLRPEVLHVDDHGAVTHQLVKVPLNELDEWDREHDEAGRLRRRHTPDEYVVETGSLEKK